MGGDPNEGMMAMGPGDMGGDLTKAMGPDGRSGDMAGPNEGYLLTTIWTGPGDMGPAEGMGPRNASRPIWVATQQWDQPIWVATQQWDQPMAPLTRYLGMQGQLAVIQQRDLTCLQWIQWVNRDQWMVDQVDHLQI